MSLITWNDYFVTGIDIIDEQHRWLIDLINQAAPMLVLPYASSNQAADELLGRLTDYAVFHFQTEHRLMAEYAIDPRHSQHHQHSHGEFAARVAEMRKRYEADGDVSGGELLTFLANWLVFHILSDDKVLTRQLKAIQEGSSPEEAFDKAEGKESDPAQQAQTKALIDLYQLINIQYSHLQAANQELEKHRHHLETLVTQRTAQLAQARDLAEAASRAKSAFLANISHEFRTPMNAIAGMNWSLLHQIDDPAQREKLQIIAKSAKHLQTMLAEVLDMVKLESEALTLEPLDFSLKALLARCCADARNNAARNGLEFIYAPASNLPDMLHGDALRIGQMLGHLLSNAVKFTTLGCVSLSVSVTGEADAMDLHLEVEDTGQGLSREDIGRLFQPFEQVDVSTKRTHGGAGLGLALCKRLANLMGGDISVQSEPGKGSRFRLDLPVQPPVSTHAASEKTAVGSAWNPSDGDVAVIDESEVQRTLKHLQDLIADDDIRALSLWHEHGATLHACLGAAASHIEHELALYNFEAALVALNKAIASTADASATSVAQ
jgi:hemerythrin-like metal-binding protein